jgi:hypothetical protein
MMNSNELKNMIRDAAVDVLMEAVPTLRMQDEKPYTFVMPVEFEGTTYYAKFGITSCQLATKAKEAYDAADTTLASDAVPNYRAQREADAAAKAAEKASKPKKSKKKDEDDE